MFTIIVDFIWLMHRHGYRFGQVLLVIKMYVLAPTFFFKSLMAVVGEEQGFLESFTGLKPAVALCVFYSLHHRKAVCTVSSRECFIQDGYSLCCVLGTLV